MADETTAQAGARPPGPDPATGATPGGQQDPGTGARPDGQGSTEGARPDTSLGEGGREALDRERTARREADRQLAEARRRVAELEDAGKSETDRARADLDRANRRIQELEAAAHQRELAEMRREVATEMGLPASLATRVQGDDLRAMRADAKKLAEEVQAGRPTGDVGIGRGAAASGQRGRVDMNTLIRQAAGRE